ncbi:MAG: hypothetical protein ACPGUC_11070, partial [Gammaproteobacteria bacterium]
CLCTTSSQVLAEDHASSRPAGTNLFNATEAAERARLDAADRALGRGYKLLLQDKPVRALPHYIEAATLAPESSEIWQELAIILYRTGHYQRSVQSAWRAIDLDAENAKAWLNLAQALARGGALRQSAQALAISRRLGTRTSKIHPRLQDLAFIAWSHGQNELARGLFRSVLKEDPDALTARLGDLMLDIDEGRPGSPTRMEALAAEALRGGRDSVARSGLNFVREHRRHGRLFYPTAIAPYTALHSNLHERPAVGRSLGLEILPYNLHGYPISYTISVEFRTPETWHVIEDDEDEGPGRLLTVLSDDPSNLKMRVRLLEGAMLGPEAQARLRNVHDELRRSNGLPPKDLDLLQGQTPIGPLYVVRLFDPSALGGERNAKRFPYRYRGFILGEAMTIRIEANTWDDDDSAAAGLQEVLSSFRLRGRLRTANTAEHEDG